MDSKYTFPMDRLRTQRLRSPSRCSTPQATQWSRAVVESKQASRRLQMAVSLRRTACAIVTPSRKLPSLRLLLSFLGFFASALVVASLLAVGLLQPEF